MSSRLTGYFVSLVNMYSNVPVSGCATKTLTPCGTAPSQRDTLTFRTRHMERYRNSLSKSLSAIDSMFSFSYMAFS